MASAAVETPSRMRPEHALDYNSPMRSTLNPRTPSRGKAGGDRFIPNRSALDMDMASFALRKENDGPMNASGVPDVTSPLQEEYKKQLKARLLESEAAANGGVAGDTAAGPRAEPRILAYKAKAPAPPSGYVNSLAGLYSANVEGGDAAGLPKRKAFRHIPQAPERILDAPELLDDYYLNLLSWSSTNLVAVALGQAVFLWNAGTGGITQLMQTTAEDDYITAVAWADDGKHIAVGTNSSEVHIWDAVKIRQVRSLKGHSARVASLAWNGSQLSSGSRDTTILNHDVRVRDHVTACLKGHEQEVCGLAWSPSGQQLASGGNDNLLHIWDASKMGAAAATAAGARGAGHQPAYLHRIDQHMAAVKALAWCPFQANVLASGGGTADRCIKFWNTHTGALLNSVDTGSQVCALQWSKHERELLSSHGYSQNQLCLWKYPSMVKMAELKGHSARVLHMAQSPDGGTVVSAAADETLRFWKVFAAPEAAAVKKTATTATGNSNMMRSINIR